MSNDIFAYYDQHSDAQTALAKLRQRAINQQRQIIGLAGLPGSGKSTLAAYLKHKLSRELGERIQTVSMDGFHLSKAQLNAQPNATELFARRGAPWTFDGQAFSQALIEFKTKPNQALCWPDFDHAKGDPEPDAIRITPATSLLLVEGLYVFHDQHGFDLGAHQLDEKWFLDVPFSEAMSRLCLRHQQAWNMSKTDARAWIAKNDQLNAEITQATRQHADWLITP